MSKELEALECIVVDLTPIAKEHNKEEIEQIKEEIESIDNQLFYLTMKDYWDRSDYEDERELIEKKNKLKEQLKELENGK